MVSTVQWMLRHRTDELRRRGISVRQDLSVELDALLCTRECKKV